MTNRSKSGSNSYTDDDGITWYWDFLLDEWVRPLDEQPPMDAAHDPEPDYEYMSEPDPFAGEAREAMGVDGW